MAWIEVYNLKMNSDHIAKVQQATLTTKEFGIEPTHGLFGSEEWWQQIENGSLPVHTLLGEIVRVYMASMNDWPMFEVIAEDGSLHQFTQQISPSAPTFDEPYVVGRKVRVDYVWQNSRKDSPDWGLSNETQVVIAIRTQH